MFKSQRIIMIVLLAGIMSAFTAGIWVGRTRGIPFVEKVHQWSIGIYEGSSPFNLISSKRIKNPVLTAKDVTDIRAGFVADPFIIKKEGIWYMFFEIMNKDTKQGDIGLASSHDGFHWHYDKVVLDEPFHMSYPYVFEWQGEYYMIPETSKAKSVRLYKAADFPEAWSFVKTLLERPHDDPSILYHDEKWWLFTAVGYDTLCLYYADDLLGPWIEHPKSPIILGNASIARPGGRILKLNNRIFRYTQDDEPFYGRQVRAFEITNLTPDSYEEKAVSAEPIVAASGAGWNAKGMHQVDPFPIEDNTWIAAVDGFGEIVTLGLQY